MLAAHLTDSHLDGTDTTRDRLRRVAEELAAATARIDLIVVTGDIVEDSAFDSTASMLEEYRLAHDLLAPLAPVAYCPGNSDGEAFDQFLNEVLPEGEGANRHVEAIGVTFLTLDSRIRGDYAGHLSDKTIAWLDASLASVSGPVVIGMHHPPVTIGHRAFDQLRLDNPEALETVISRFPNVVGIFCGHIHMALATRFGGVDLAVAQGIHSSGSLPWVLDDDPSVLIDPTAPPAFTMHRVDASGLTSFPVVLREDDV
jgi:3',5'-cyclic-AMP phosphodiesterase